MDGHLQKGSFCMTHKVYIERDRILGESCLTLILFEVQKQRTKKGGLTILTANVDIDLIPMRRLVSHEVENLQAETFLSDTVQL